MTIAINEQSAVDFVLTLRRRWADTLYPALAEQAADIDPGRIDAVAAVHALPAWRWFAWLERGSQKMLWRAATNAIGADTIEEAPADDLPDWYTGCDIHLQPGGVWRSAHAAALYEFGARLVMLGENDDYAFHTLFVSSAIPDAAYRTIVDLGCGFGKSTWPMKAAFPGAEVIGVDLAEPCLALARRRCEERGLDVAFQRADAAATGLDDDSADLVTSTMLIHEMPGDQLAALYREAARVLRPGGLLRFLDFQPTGQWLRDRMIVEHSDRNNEPYLAPMMAQDQVELAKAAGFVDVRWRAFDERGPGILPDLRWPDRREWHFPWAVLEARLSDGGGGGQ
jgi:ubiquinone/menaquinone biosynthesis C-methylase UbiE